MNKFLSCLCCLAIILGLAACSSSKETKKWDSVCPKIVMTDDTYKKDVFDGKGTDELNKLYSVELMGYEGKCGYDKKTKEVTLNLDVNFNTDMGPAAKDPHVEFYYFVAVPDLYPDAAGKRVFMSEVNFTKGSDDIDFVDKGIEIKFPLAKDKKPQDIEVYLGLQLTDEELQFNRKNKLK